MKNLPPEEVAKHLAWHFTQQGIATGNGPSLADIVMVQAERVKTLKEMAAQSRLFFEGYDEPDPGAAQKHLRPVAAEPLRLMQEGLRSLEDWSPAALHAVIDRVAAQLGVGVNRLGETLGLIRGQRVHRINDDGFDS